MSPYLENVRYLYELCAGKGLISYSVGIAIHSLFNAAIPFFLGMFIDSLIYGGKTLILFTILVCSAFFTWLIALFLRKKIIQIARNREQILQIHLLDAFKKMKPSAIDVYRNGEIAMKFYRDAGNIEQFIVNIYPQFLNLLFGLISALGLILYKKPLIMVFYIFFLPVILFCSGFFIKRFAHTAHAVRSVYDHSINSIFEFMYIFPYLKSMDADTPYCSAPARKFQIYRKINIINDVTNTALEFVNRFLLFLGEYSVLGIAGYMAWKKMIPIGDVVMFQVLFLSVLNSFSGMCQILPNLKMIQESIVSIRELLKNDQIEDIDCHQPIQTVLSDIFVNHISFQYPNATQNIFKDFSCKIKAGTIVALTGMNGCGKTTLLKLLTGYLIPDEGSIEIAGKQLHDWQIRTFRQKIAYVFQDSLLITGTIKDNITLKNTKYTEQEILDALHLSGADQFVARIPDGLNHKIGQNGGGLSGGERQKIAIARALIRKPEILIFDEVTNHLDYQSRLKIRDLISSLRTRTTIFMVSHDPEIIKLCDQEINLDHQNKKDSL